MNIETATCPQCQSNNTEKFQQIYENGKTYEENTEIGNIIKLTPLAKKYSPPEKPQFGCLYIIVIVAISINFNALFYAYFDFEFLKKIIPDFLNLNILFILFYLLFLVFLHIIFGIIIASSWQLIIGKKETYLTSKNIKNGSNTDYAKIVDMNLVNSKNKIH